MCLVDAVHILPSLTSLSFTSSLSTLSRSQPRISCPSPLLFSSSSSRLSITLSMYRLNTNASPVMNFEVLAYMKTRNAESKSEREVSLSPSLSLSLSSLSYALSFSYYLLLLSLTLLSLSLSLSHTLSLLCPLLSGLQEDEVKASRRERGHQASYVGDE